MGKKFELNGMEVVIKKLTLGDAKEIVKAIKAASEEEYAEILVCHAVGLSNKEYYALPIESMKEVQNIVLHINSLLGFDEGQ